MASSRGFENERIDATILHPPASWMKIMAIDPGRHRSGCLCAAIPPPGPDETTATYRPKHIHFYAEVMVYNANCKRMAEVARELTGPWLFEAFIIDKKGSDPTPIGQSTTSIREQYADEFKKHGLRSRLYGEDFSLGSADINAREMRLKEWMNPPEPILKVHSNCVNFQRQIKDFFLSPHDHTKREPGKKKAQELIHCAEYLAGYFNGTLYYYPPEKAPEPEKTDENKLAEFLKLCQKTNFQPFDPRQKNAIDFGKVAKYLGY